MTTTLIDGIGLLYTGDPEREEIPDAALVLADGLVTWVGPAARAPTPTSDWTCEGAPSSPASSTATLT